MPRALTAGLLAAFSLLFADAPEASAGTVIQWATMDGGNGHYYEFVSAPGISWHDANNAADAMTFLASLGHLVTVTSQAENDFLKATFGSRIGDPTPPPNHPVIVPGVYAWIGLSDQITTGAYQWVTGEPFSYSNWGIGEPSGPQGYPDQQYIYYWQRDYGNRPDFSWDDTVNTPPLSGYDAYIVEFDGPFAVPEPCMLTIGGILLALGGVFQIAVRRYRSAGVFQP